MKTGREQVEMIALYEELGSYRAVAALVGCDHKTVKRYVELAGEQGQLAPARRRARITDEFAALIRERVEATEGQDHRPPPAAHASRRRLRGLRALAAARGRNREGRLPAPPRRLRARLPPLGLGAGRVAHLRLGGGRQGPDPGRPQAAVVLLLGARLLPPPPAHLLAHGALRGAREWCARVNAEPHSETRRAPEELLAAERELLRPLPASRPPLALGEERKVDRLATIRFASARYSVPHRLVGETVEALATDRELIVTHRGVPVAQHPLLGPGEVSVADEHYPTPVVHFSVPESGARFGSP